MTTLVIVESPGKLKAIRSYLGPTYRVEATVGHIRDLPRTKDEIPESHRSLPWAKIGIDPATFDPLYIVVPEKRQVVATLRQAAKAADRVLFATDGDREGEAIAWHASRVLKITDPQRIVFTEITRAAVQTAVKSPRPLNLPLVAAQETRRAIDRLVGFRVSPLLWDTVGRHPRTGKQSSAGRVQSAALMLMTLLEFGRMTHVPAVYHTLTVTARTTPPFTLTCTHIKSRDAGVWLALARKGDFAHDGTVKKDVRVLTDKEAQALSAHVHGKTLTVTAVTPSEVRSSPPPPFTTSTLQQKARSLKMTPKDIMAVAQELYEQGYITYMRTDSPHLSEEALSAARHAVEALFGPTALPVQPRRYAAKSKGAQEAHEAIRPSGTTFRTPAETALAGRQLAVYTLIYHRTLASQMLDTVYAKTTLTAEGASCRFQASGRTLLFEGHTRLVAREQDGDDTPPLPNLQPGDTFPVDTKGVRREQTTPPARLTESTLVKAMEASGIGRPATYASSIATLHDRGYIRSLSGDSVGVTAYGVLNITYLDAYLPKLIAREFTATMEAQLDEIAAGRVGRVAFLREFYQEQLEPLIRAAAKTSPTVALPHLEGVTLTAAGGCGLIIQGQRYALDADAIPADLTADDVQSIASGQWARLQAEPRARTRGEEGQPGTRAKGTASRSPKRAKTARAQDETVRGTGSSTRSPREGAAGKKETASGKPRKPRMKS